MKGEWIMAGLQEYKCPCCGGAIAFDQYDPKDEVPILRHGVRNGCTERIWCRTAGWRSRQYGWETTAEEEVNGKKEKQMVCAHMCVNPVEEIVGDANTAATSCPFCDNPIVMMGQFPAPWNRIWSFRSSWIKKQRKKRAGKAFDRENVFCRRFSRIRIISMRSKVSMYHSGFLIPM